MWNKKRTAGILALIMMLGTACGGGTPDMQAPLEAENATAEAEEVPAEAETEPTEEETAPAASDEAETAPVDPATLYEPVDETVTFMIYMTGSDLESSAAAATNDMAEIAQSGIDLSRVNLLVFTGGAPMWHSDNPEIPTDANVLYHLTENGYEEVERLEPLSMGDSANLERFLTYSYEHYPADTYDLVLWDHGNGPVIGYGSDKQFGGDSLTLPEMREALEASPYGEGNQLSLIGFDACLMSSAELMCVCATYAEYLVASQETEPSFGWNYSFLGMAGKICTEDLTREIVREYNSFCEEYFAGNEFFRSDVTLAAIDLSYGKEMEEALDTLFSAAAGDVSGNYNKLAKARVNTHGFGRASTGSEYDLVDLGNLMEQMAEKYPEETAAVLGVVEKAVLVSEANVGESCGLSLFYPYYNKSYYKKSWKEGYAQLNAFPNYASFLSRYEQVWMGTDLKELFNDALVPQAGKDSETFTMQLTPEQAEQFAFAQYYILRKEGDGVYGLVFASADVTEKKGLLTANFDGNVIYYRDDYDTRGIPPTRMYDTVDGVTSYELFGFAENGRISSDNLESINVGIQVAVDKTAGELTVKGIYSTDDEEEISTGKKEALNPQDFQRFSFYNITGRYLTRDENDRILPYWEWPEGGWILGRELPVANGLHFTYEPLYDDGEEYFIMFEVADVQDNRYSSELLPITLAQAPPEAETVERTELTWEEGPEFPVLEERDVKVSIRLVEDSSTGMTILEGVVQDDAEIPVHVNLEDLYVNGNLYTGYTDVYLWTEAGKTYRTKMNALMETCRLAGIEIPESISFTLSMQHAETAEYLIYKKPYIVYLGEKLRPEVVKVPVLGAQAGRQELTEAEGVTVELLELGDREPLIASEPDLYARYRITNSGAEAKKIVLYGLVINGIYFESLHRCTLEPGERWLKTQRIGSDPIRELKSVMTGFDREERIHSISEVSAVVQLGDTLLLCPVELALKGEQGIVEAQGDLLYEDERVRLSVESFRTEEREGEPDVLRYIWEVWLENKTGEYHSFQLAEVGSGAYDNLVYSNIGPQSRMLLQIVKKAERGLDGMQVIIQYGGNGGGAKTESEPFTLDAQEP